jgi:hypothetical protein
MAAVVAFGLLLTWLGSQPAAPLEVTGRKIVFGLGLAAVAGGFLFWVPMQRALARQRSQAKLESDFPDQPWRWRPEWNAGCIASEGGRAAAVTWFVALVWNTISWTAVGAAYFKHGSGENVVWLVLLFPLVGVFVLWSAIYQSIRARKFGRPVFLPTSVPGVIGGYLGGVIQVPAALRPDEDVTLALQACRTTVHGSGKNRSVQSEVLWENEVRVVRENLPVTAAGTGIPVLFHIPAGQPASDVTTTDPRTFWRLTAKAPVAGVDFAATFEVPVFATGETAPAPTPDQPLLAGYRATPLTSESLAAAGIDLRSAGPGEFSVVVFTSRHIRGTQLAMSGLTLAGTAGVAVLFWFGWWIPAILVGFFDLIFGLAAWSIWMGETSVELLPAEVVVRSRGAAGWKEQRLLRREVAWVQVEKSMRLGESQYYRVMLVGHPGADPAQPSEGEPFALRKLRYQLSRARTNPGGTVAGQSQPELLAELRLQPRFRVTAATHVPGPAFAESVARMLEQKLLLGRPS